MNMNSIKKIKNRNNIKIQRGFFKKTSENPKVIKSKSFIFTYTKKTNILILKTPHKVLTL